MVDIRGKLGKTLRGLSRVLGVSALLLLVACGRGESDRQLNHFQLEHLQSDPRVARLVGITESGRTLLLPSVHVRYKLSGRGFFESDSFVQEARCSTTYCRGDLGEEWTIDDLLDPSHEGFLKTLSLDAVGSFDTATSRSMYRDPNKLRGVAITDFPEGTNYGLWGDYGYAAAVLRAGPVSGRLEIVSVEGDIEHSPIEGEYAVVTAFAFGDTTEANPSGIGSATWRGIAEATSISTLERVQGSAEISVPNLSSPRVRLEVVILNESIGSGKWSEVMLLQGHYQAGRVGDDFVSGSFFGPRHDETYGVFDTRDYVGAFGAKRTPSE